MRFACYGGSVPSTSIPVVSLADYRGPSDDKRRHFLDTFGRALHEFGFVSVVDHGVERPLIERAYAIIAEFFALSADAKKRCVVEGSGGNRGFVGFGLEHAKNRSVGDLKEFFHVGRELPELGAGGRNAFPAELPDFETVTRALYAELDRTGAILLEAFAETFDAPRDTFSKLSSGGNSILRLIHYPPLKSAFIPGAVRAAEHEDINLMTLLCESTGAGLEILTRDGKWLAVDAPPGHIVVDTGDMMHRITAGTVPATTHRVVNPPREAEDVERYSMPFFVHPRPDALLEVLPFCASSPGASEEAARAEPIVAQAFLEERLRALGLM